MARRNVIKIKKGNEVKWEKDCRKGREKLCGANPVAFFWMSAAIIIIQVFQILPVNHYSPLHIQCQTKFHAGISPPYEFAVCVCMLNT